MSVRCIVHVYVMHSKFIYEILVYSICVRWTSTTSLFYFLRYGRMSIIMRLIMRDCCSILYLFAYKTFFIWKNSLSIWDCYIEGPTSMYTSSHTWDSSWPNNVMRPEIYLAHFRNLSKTMLVKLSALYSLIMASSSVAGPIFWPWDGMRPRLLSLVTFCRSMQHLAINALGYYTIIILIVKVTYRPRTFIWAISWPTLTVR